VTVGIRARADGPDLEALVADLRSVPPVETGPR
jgi:hypothetical protein